MKPKLEIGAEVEPKIRPNFVNVPAYVIDLFIARVKAAPVPTLIIIEPTEEDNEK